MKNDDPSRSQEQPIDTISVDFITILSKLVEDNDSLQKRIEAIEKSNLQKRVDALEKSFRLFTSAQQENEGLHKSMTKLISILQDTDLRKGCPELRKEHRRPETHAHNEFPNDDRRSHDSLRESSKRFKSIDEKARGSSNNYRSNSSHESRSSPSRHQHDDKHSRPFCKAVKRVDSEHPDRYQDHHSRRSYDAERSSHERGRAYIISQKSSSHHDAKPLEYRRITERPNSSEHRKRPQHENRPSSGEFNHRDNRDSHHFTENRSREVKDSNPPVENRPRETKDPRQSTDDRSRVIRDPKLSDVYRLREIEDGKQGGDCRPKDDRNAKPSGDYRTKEDKESVPSDRFRKNEFKDFRPAADGRSKENKESKQPSDGRTNENKESKQSTDHYAKENRDTAVDMRIRESKNSKQPNDSRMREDRKSVQSEDCHRSEGELSDDHAEENEDLSRKDPKSSGDKDGGPTDPRLNHIRAHRVDIPSPMLPLWGTADEIDLKKIHSTPMKFLSSLTTIMNHSMISPLPTTPDQLKEKFKQHVTVKVSPMPSFLNDEEFEEKKEVRQPKEFQITIEAPPPPQNQDCVEVKTVVETDDAEHGVFKRRRRAR